MAGAAPHKQCWRRGRPLPLARSHKRGVLPGVAISEKGKPKKKFGLTVPRSQTVLLTIRLVHRPCWRRGRLSPTARSHAFGLLSGEARSETNARVVKG